jgi:sulfur-carrier protein
MAVVRLRAPLSELAGGRQELQVEGATVREVLRALEREHPAIAGWILDEQVSIRRHVNVFVNGEKSREDTECHADDRIHVIPSISGG